MAILTKYLKNKPPRMEELRAPLKNWRNVSKTREEKRFRALALPLTDTHVRVTVVGTKVDTCDYPVIDMILGPCGPEVVGTPTTYGRSDDWQKGEVFAIAKTLASNLMYGNGTK